MQFIAFLSFCRNLRQNSQVVEQGVNYNGRRVYGSSKTDDDA